MLVRLANGIPMLHGPADSCAIREACLSSAEKQRPAVALGHGLLGTASGVAGAESRATGGISR